MIAIGRATEMTKPVLYNIDIGAILTICIMTILWKENPLFRFAEHLLIGIAAAHSTVRTIDNYLRPTIQDQIVAQGQWGYILLLLFGCLMYLRHAPNLSWVARYPMSWFVGYGVGYTLAFSPKPFLKQIIDTFIPLKSIDNVLYFVVTIITVSYFFFTPKWRAESSAGKVLDVWARRVMMIGFGATFGNVVQGRISILLGRLQFLLHDWLGVI